MTSAASMSATTYSERHANPAHPQTEQSLQALRHLVGPDGCVPVLGGTKDEKLAPLALSPHADQASRSLFTDLQIRQDLERLAGEQQADGG
jgi:hypothetical protein